MNRAKQLVEVDGERMVRRAVKIALASGAPDVILVTGAYAGEVASAVDDLVRKAAGRLRVVYNAAWEAGQAGSMQVGLRALGDEVGAAVFLPVDQPYLEPQLLQQLVAAWQAGALIAAPQVNEELRGAPALFDRSLWMELYGVKGDVGARGVLRAHAAEVKTVDAPATWLRDVDTPEDLAAVSGSG